MTPPVSGILDPIRARSVLAVAVALVACTATSASSGALLVGSLSNARVMKYDSVTGASLGVFANSGGGTAGVALGSDGVVYVTTWTGIFGFDLGTGAPTGSMTSTANGRAAFGPDGRLYNPRFGTDDVEVFNIATQMSEGLFVTPGSGGLDGTSALTFGPDGNLYVSGRISGQVNRYNGVTGAFLDVFISTGGNNTQGLTFGPDGNLYVAFSAVVGDGLVRRYNGTTGVYIDDFATGIPQTTDGMSPVFGPDGNLYVSSQYGNSVHRFDGTTGAFIDIFVPGGTGISFTAGMAFVSICGDGTIDTGEDCDDGNLLAGDCCSATCGFEAEASPCTSDSNDCTDDACDAAGTCVYTNTTDPCDDGEFCTVSDTCQDGTCTGSARDCADSEVCTTDSCDEFDDVCVNAETPVSPEFCLAAPKAKFQVTDSATAGKDKLSWQWSAGAAFDQSDLGTPLVDTTYTLCVYDQAAGELSIATSIELAASGSLWTSKDPKGLAYKDKLGSSDGATKALLKTGDGVKTKVKLTASGTNLLLPGPVGPTYFAQDTNVVVQLVNSAGSCWTSQFVAADTTANDADSFKALVK